MAVVKEYLQNKVSLRPAKTILFYFSYLGLLLYSLGYFMIGGGFSNHGFGKFKMNLNALFDPMAEVTLSASQIFPELETPSINSGFGGLRRLQLPWIRNNIPAYNCYSNMYLLFQTNIQITTCSYKSNNSDILHIDNSICYF